MSDALHDRPNDCIVIGGGYAGMSAALQLLRARRRVAVVDAGRRRNRFASHSHGFLGQDGADPAEIARIARAQLSAYPTLTWIEGEAVEASGAPDAFRVTLASGEVLHGRRLLLATGVADALPPVPGLDARWGRSVFHCPYCHGYELDLGPVGVIATGPMSLHQAQMLPDWGPTTLLTNAALTLDAAARSDLAARGVAVEETPVAGLEDEATPVLSDGRRLAFAGLFVATRSAPASPLPAALGCDMVETPLGRMLRTDEGKRTSRAGVFACGDLAHAPHSVALAVGDGAWAGAQAHRSLLFPEG